MPENQEEEVENDSEEEQFLQLKGDCDDGVNDSDRDVNYPASSQLSTSNEPKDPSTSRATETPITYNPQKPKWWKYVAGKATKAQKRSIHNVLDIHGLRLPQIDYGTKYNWNQIFDTTNEDKKIWLELGFGRGENILALAHQYRKDRDFYLIGGEIHKPGIGVACQRIEHAAGWITSKNDSMNGKVRDEDDKKFGKATETHRYWADYVKYSPELDPCTERSSTNYHQIDDTIEIKLRTSPHESGNYESNNREDIFEEEQPYQRLRMYAGDGFKLLAKIPSNTLHGILVTFPDPFPKNDGQQWRLIQKETLLKFHRILYKRTITKNSSMDNSHGGGLFYLATDHDGYYGWCHEMIRQVNEQPKTLRQNTDDQSYHVELDQQSSQDTKSNSTNQPLFELIEPCPNRLQWLPAISTYEQKGWDEGRSTKLSCWKALSI